jgi:cyclic nucleotide-binding protein
MAALAVGSLLAPALVALGGTRGAFAGAAALLAVAAAGVARRVAAIDAHATVPVTEIALLRIVPMFAPLDPASLEALARSLEPVALGSGETLIRQGERGADHYFVVADGVLDVRIDGLHVRDAVRGDGVGELALLVDVPRTATVTARTAVHAQSLGRTAFLGVIAENVHSAEIADRLVHERLPGATLAP